MTQILIHMSSRRFAWFLASLFVCITIVMAELRYRALNTTFFDLGIFENVIYRIGNGEWRLLFGAYAEPVPYVHFQPILILYAVLYKLIPASEVLFVLQSIALGLSFIPLARLGERHLDQSSVKLLLLAFLLSSSLWYNALFDFHTDHLIIPLALWAIVFCEEQKSYWFVFTLVCMCIVKENFIFTASLLAFCYTFIHRNKWAFLLSGLLFIAGYSVSAYVIPAFAPVKGLPLPGFERYGTRFSDVVITVTSHPWLILQSFNSAKIIFIFVLFVPTLFLSLIRPMYFLPSLFSLSFILLSDNQNHSSYTNQYTAGVIPFIFASVVVGTEKLLWWLERFGKNRAFLFSAVLLSSILIHIISAPSPIGLRFFLPHGRYSYTQYYSEYAQEKSKILERIVPNDVPVSIQNQVWTSWLVRRNNVVPFPTGIAQETPYSHLTINYVVVDTTSPLFVVGKVDTQTFKREYQILRIHSEELIHYKGLEIFKMAATNKKNKE